MLLQLHPTKGASPHVSSDLRQPRTATPSYGTILDVEREKIECSQLQQRLSTRRTSVSHPLPPNIQAQTKQLPLHQRFILATTNSSFWEVPATMRSQARLHLVCIEVCAKSLRRTPIAYCLRSRRAFSLQFCDLIIPEHELLGHKIHRLLENPQTAFRTVEMVLSSRK